MKLDNADKFLLNLYYKDKTKLFPQEIEYCEKLIKKIITKIIENDLKGLLIQDTVSSIYFGIHENEDILKNWIHSHKEIKLLVLYKPLLLKGYTCFLECYPIAYLKKEPFNYKSE